MPLREAHLRDDFTFREEMVQMRGGVRLETLILTPKEHSEPLPILLERTSYDATWALGDRSTTALEVARSHKDLGGGYTVMAQDIRGRYRSEGGYAMYRVPRSKPQ